MARDEILYDKMEHSEFNENEFNQRDQLLLHVLLARWVLRCERGPLNMRFIMRIDLRGVAPLFSNFLDLIESADLLGRRIYHTVYAGDRERSDCRR